MTIDKKFDVKELETFAETRVSHVPGEEFLGQEIFQHEQVHLAVAYKGNPDDYLDIARLELAKKAKTKGCEYVVDGDYCQNRIDEGTVIFAGTGLRPLKRKSLDEKVVNSEIFAEENISHISAREFFQRINDSPDNYKSIEITISYQGKQGEDYLQLAELKLAETAIRKECQYVTEMDYIAHDPENRTVAIAARGFRKKIDKVL